MRSGATIDACAAAAFGKYDQLIAILRADPAQANDCTTGSTPLGWAAYANDTRAGQILIDHGAIVHPRLPRPFAADRCVARDAGDSRGTRRAPGESTMPHLMLDEDFLSRLLPSARLSVSDVEVIGQLAFLAAEIDLDEDVDELHVLVALNRGLWRIVGRPPALITPISPVPIDREERARAINELVPRLTTVDARELAYVVAYLVIVIDLELAPVEGDLLGELEAALELEPGRAEQLALAGATMLTALDPAEPPTLGA